MKKVRLYFLDSMKGILITNVVLAHSMLTAADAMETKNAWIIEFFSYFTIAAFFFISGFLYNNKTPDKPLKTIIHKVRVYYIPFVLFNVFYLACHNLFIKIHFLDGYLYDLKTFIKHFVLIFLGKMELSLNGPMWYLRSLLIMTVVYIIVEYLFYKIGDEKLKLILMGVLFIVMAQIGVLKLLPDNYNINQTFYYIQFFYVGFLFKKFKIYEIIKKYKMLLFIVGFGIVIVLNLTTHAGTTTDYVLHFVKSFGAYSAIIALVALTQFEKIEMFKFLHILGTASLDIMSVHFLFFKPVTLFIIAISGYSIERLAETPVLFGVEGGWFVLYTLVAMALSTAFYYCRTSFMKKIKHIKPAKESK
ncbi:MAG: acyltransferase family protein [Butyrivibrio sp.]|nr:acyltransferase family protein [Butyrivibrio sp.]